MQYLIDTYSLAKLKVAYHLEEKAKQNTWTTAFGKPLAQLEQDWLAWIAVYYGK